MNHRSLHPESASQHKVVSDPPQSVLLAAGWFDFDCLDYQVKFGGVLSSQHFSALEKLSLSAEEIEIFGLFSQESFVNPCYCKNRMSGPS